MTDNLPENYTPYDTLLVCSNKISGGAKIASIDGIYPLLIGKGKRPLIWLQAIVDSKSRKFEEIITESVSKHPLVNLFDDGSSIHVKVSGEKILSLRLKESNVAEVHFLDLRPIGLDIHGNKNSLQVGFASFSNSSMSGGGALVGVG